jgi:hypothetical protein
MFGKRYAFSIVGAVIVAFSGVLIGTGGQVITGYGLALLTVLPVFWYESREGSLDTRRQIEDSYTSLAEELLANLSILGETKFFAGGVPTIELQRVAWDGLLSSGRIAKLPEKERGDLRAIFREISSLNQYLRLSFELATIPPSTSVELGRGPIESRMRTFPDPETMKDLTGLLKDEVILITARAEKLVMRWKSEGKTKLMGQTTILEPKSRSAQKS